jgi:hypothetical protein
VLGFRQDNERRDIQEKKKEKQGKEGHQYGKISKEKDFQTSSMRWQSMVREDFLNATLVYV